MKNKLWGILFLLLAGAVVLHELQIIPNVPIFLIIATVFCGGWLLKSLPRFEIFGLIAPSTILFILYNGYFKWTKIGTGTIVLIAVLVYFGLALLFNRTKTSNYRKVTSSTGAKSRFAATLGESTHYITDKQLDELSIDCFMGELNLDFVESGIRGDTLTLNTSVMFGTLKLYLPKDWVVVNNASVLFAEVDMPPYMVSGTKTLIIEGSVMFGEINIRYI